MNKTAGVYIFYGTVILVNPDGSPCREHYHNQSCQPQYQPGQVKLPIGHVRLRKHWPWKLHCWKCQLAINTLRPRQNGRHFTDDIFKYIFLNENVWIPVKISLKFVPKGAINNIPALVQIMTWRRSGDKPLSEAMAVGFPTHICVTLPLGVNILTAKEWYRFEICFKSVLKIYLIKSGIWIISLCYLMYA